MRPVSDTPPPSDFCQMFNPGAPGTLEATLPPAQALLARLLSAQVVLLEEWEEITAGERDAITRATTIDGLLMKLQAYQLLSRFQADTIRKGATDDLVLGNYRLLDV